MLSWPELADRDEFEECLVDALAQWTRAFELGH
ncbi:hypothetical protein M877_05565 [Streptomyces niveus NCIMB 11891]|nr:hypothetical protein M877_05565 [Streptomyces niveus NCIMB 11891]